MRYTETCGCEWHGSYRAKSCSLHIGTTPIGIPHELAERLAEEGSCSNCATLRRELEGTRHQRDTAQNDAEKWSNAHAQAIDCCNAFLDARTITTLQMMRVALHHRDYWKIHKKALKATGRELTEGEEG